MKKKKVQKMPKAGQAGNGTKPHLKRRSPLISDMKSIDEVKQALKEMETRRTAACLDMCSVLPNGVKYDTDIIRRLESIDVTIHTLKWVLQPSKANGDRYCRSFGI